jgi:hypothetical protein
MKIYPTLKFLIFATFWILQDIVITHFQYQALLSSLSSRDGWITRSQMFRGWDQADQIRKKLRKEKSINHKFYSLYRVFENPMLIFDSKNLKQNL